MSSTSITLTKHVGVLFQRPPTNQELALFDEFRVVLPEKGALESTFSNEETAARLDYLITQGVASPCFSPELAKNMAIRKRHQPPEFHDPLADEELWIRAACIDFRIGTYDNIVPIVYGPSRLHSTTCSGTEDVLQFVLQRFPIPDDDVPVEDILDFRRQNQREMRRFWSWMQSLGVKQPSQPEIAAELQQNLDNYTETLERNRLNYRKGVLRAVLTITAAIAQSLDSLMFIAAANALLSWKVQRTKHIEGEREDPGRDVAYFRSVEVLNRS